MVAWIGYDRDGKSEVVFCVPSLAVSEKAFFMN